MTVSISGNGAVTGVPQIGGPAFSAYLSANQTLPNTTFTKVALDVEEFDTNNCFASGRFTPNVPGYYQINWTACFEVTAATGASVTADLYKNGSRIQAGGAITKANSQWGNTTGSRTVYMNGTTDYLELYAYSPAMLVYSGQGGTSMSGHLVRAA